MSRWPLIVRGLVIAGCGILLGLGGCFGFLATMQYSDSQKLGTVLAVLGGGVFFAGLIGLAIGAIMFVIGAFKWFFGRMAPESK